MQARPPTALTALRAATLLTSRVRATDLWLTREMIELLLPDEPVQPSSLRVPRFVLSDGTLPGQANLKGLLSPGRS